MKTAPRSVRRPRKPDSEKARSASAARFSKTWRTVLPNWSALPVRFAQKASTNACACSSVVIAWKAAISSGVASRAMGPISQPVYSGPRNGLVKSVALGVGVPAQPASSAQTRINRTDSLRAPEQIKELLSHGFLVEDAAQGGGDGERARLLDAAHLDAQVARLDDHHGALRLELVDEEGDHLLGQPLLELRPLGVELQDA